MIEIDFQNGKTKLNKKMFDTFQNNIKTAINDAILEAKRAENPVGHIRMETTNINPATYLGFGTWVLWGSGRVPVGVDRSDTNFNTVEKTGGEKTHTLTVNENAKHDHLLNLKSVQVASGSGSWVAQYAETGQNISSMQSAGGQAHNNLQPYITCYMWKRVS